MSKHPERATMISLGGKSTWQTMLKKLKPGDIIQMIEEGKLTPHHSMIVVKVMPNDVLIAEHTVNAEKNMSDIIKENPTQEFVAWSIK